jgi:hypothetical protein
MDCKTARLLLDFARPHAPEVDATDTAELDRHLAACPVCAALANEERRLDDVLGRAMRRVEVPSTLRPQLLHRLEAERAERDRRRVGHFLRVAAAIAACLLIVTASVYAWRTRTPRPDPKFDDFQNEVRDRELERAMHQREHDKVEEFYKQQYKITVALPAEWRYEYLRGSALADFHGQKVPYLLFVYDKEDDGSPLRTLAGDYVAVYVLSEKQFDLDQLPGGIKEGYAQLKISVDVRQTPSGRYAYVCVYNSDNLNWLRPARN